jgi:peptidoglycan/LPS O-acetylase OafA/YrhL
MKPNTKIPLLQRQSPADEDLSPGNVKDKIYFPGLNGLRFIAALLVIIHHIEQIKNLSGFQNHKQNTFVSVSGKLGVVLFFVLSGFLITYLLLEEEKKTKTISIKNFYIRRILRIWPLYYLIVVLSFFVFSKLSFLQTDGYSFIFDNFSIKLILFILFLPNLAENIFPAVPYSSQTWSVGVEEQFYLVWPLLMKKVKNKSYLLYSIVGGYVFIKLIGFIIIKKFLFWNNYMNVIRKFFDSFSIDCMAIGGLFALYLFNKEKILIFFFKPYVQLLTISALCVLIGFGVRIPYIHFEFYAILFGILILNLAANPKPVISLESKLLNYLGKISYGLYIYHPLAIVITIKCLNILGFNIFILQHVISLLIAILMAGISYRFYESYFIRKKIKFSKILSGDNAKSNR